MKPYWIAGAAAVAVAAGVAWAQPSDKPAWGADMSVSDMQARHAERFNAMDANKDGQLSREEMQSYQPQRGEGQHGWRGHRGGFGMRHGGPDGAGGHGGPGGHGPMFKHADANNDGVITRQEYDADAASRFQQLDANKDGQVNGEEAQASREHMRAEMKTRMAERHFAMLDADNNGSVSRAEFDRKFSERIQRLDANKDGKITRDERRAGRERPDAAK